MTEINFVEIAVVLVVILVLMVNSKVSKLKKEANEDRGMLCLLLKESLAKKVEDLKAIMNKINEGKVKGNGKNKHKNKTRTA